MTRAGVLQQQQPNMCNIKDLQKIFTLWSQNAVSTQYLAVKWQLVATNVARAQLC